MHNTTPESDRVSLRTRFSYGFGCIGRDATYTLVSNFIMTYLTLAVGLSNWQLGALGVVLVVARIWDAANDPIMGIVIDNTHSRWGKFKPFILAGAALNSVCTVLLFTTRTQNEVLFIVLFAITYLLWDITYTMNDIGYWGMLPSLTVNPKEREKVTSLARIGANVGLFAVTALVPMLTAGQMVPMYRNIAIGIAVLFVACQLLVVLGVQGKHNALTSSGQNRTRLRDILSIIFKNDQLLVIAGAILLFNIGYFTTTGFGVQFFYFDYGNYGGMEFTYFALVIGVAQLLTLALSPLLSRRLTRRAQFGLGTAMVGVGYLGFMAVGYVLPMNMVVLCIIGFILFSGQALIQLLNYVLLADTVEYGQWKLGTRNESIIFSVNPFITKMASAIQAGIFSLTMILSGLNPFAQRLSQLENDPALSPEEVIRRGNEIVAEIPGNATLFMRLSMIILPLALILTCFAIYRKKYVLNEQRYGEIVADLRARAEMEGKHE